MPSHIFTRVGAWEESIATNRRSAKVALAGNEADEAYHASDYAVYALLQLARDDEARREMEAALKVQGFSERFVAFYVWRRWKRAMRSSEATGATRWR